jgi:ribonuclease P protein subunit POP4
MTLRTAKNILQHELIGAEVQIVECPFPEKCGTGGLILDESRNMLVIEMDQTEIKIPKEGSRFAFELPADESEPDNIQRIEIEGNRLLARPEDRVKRNEPKTRRK